MAVVNFIGIKQFDTDESRVIKTLVQRHMEKIERIIPGYKLVFHTKLYKTQGKVKYSFNGRVTNPNIRLHSEAADWNLSTTVHKVMKKLFNEAKKQCRVGSQPQEKFHPKRAKRGTDTRIKLRK